MPEMKTEGLPEYMKLHDLHLEGPFEGCRITDLRMHAAPGEHAGMWIRADQRLSQAKEWIYRELDGIPVAVKAMDGQILFCGPIRHVTFSVSGGSCTIGLELVSGSTFLDLREASASFQDGHLSYRHIMKETVGEIKGGAIIFPGIGDDGTGQPIIRYQETAWAFLARLASHKGVPLVADIHTTGAARIFAGLPDLQTRAAQWEDGQIRRIYQDGRFLSLGGSEAGLDPSYFLVYDIVDPRIFQIGQKGLVRGRRMRVAGVDAHSHGGELIFCYHVAAEQYCYVPRRSNRKISGMSLLGTVTGRRGEDIWLHLDIDGDRDSPDSWGWPWTPPTGNFMYLMPPEGSRVSLYFGNGDERSGRGINCIAQGSGGNPRERWLRTEHKKSLNMLEGGMSLVSESGGNSITMDQTTVRFQGQDITLSGQCIRIRGSKVSLTADGDRIFLGAGPILGEGKDAGKLDPTAFVGLTRDSLEITGENRTILEGEEQEVDAPPYPDGPEEGRFNLGKAAMRASVTVVVIGGSAVLVCASMGAATPVLAGAAATAALAGGSMLVTDAMRGSVSSWDEYALNVGSAELMFFTNMAATQLIAIAGMGAVGGALARGGAQAAAGAGLDYLVNGEVDRKRLALNLVINVGVDLGVGAVSGEPMFRGRQRGGGSFQGQKPPGGSAFGEMSPEDALRYNKYWDDVKAGRYDIPYGMTDGEYYQFLKGMDRVDVGIKGGREADELKISARNTSRGNPNAINHFDAELNTRQQNLLNQLPDYDSSVIIKKSDVNLNDLSALTAKTGDEFAMFTRGSQRLIVRGGSTNVNIDSVRAQELYDAGYKWSGHTHPGTDFNVKMPSPGDKGILNIFKQEQSVIYDSKGRYELFGGN